MSADAQQHTPCTDSDRLSRLDPVEPPARPHPLRHAPERLARVSQESASVRRVLWARVNREIARLGGASERARPSPVLPEVRPARPYARAVRRRPDL